MAHYSKLSITLVVLIALFLASSTQAQNALNFDGTNDRVQTTFGGVLGSANRTFEAWVNISPNATGNNCIFDYGLNAVGSRNTFAIGGNNQLSFISGGTNANISSPANSVPAGQWNHVAFVLNNGTGFMYVNGVQVATGNLSTVNTPSGNSALRIGDRVPGGSIPFLGAIDEVRVWNYARSATEISNNLNTEFCLIPTGLVAYYKFNQGVAGGSNSGVTTAPDASGGGNNGILTNFSLTGASSNWVAGVTLGVGVITNTVAILACDTFTSPSGNNVWTTSGTYLDTVQTSLGCDSALTINLTVGATTFGAIAPVVCASYTSPSGNYTWTASGTYNDTIPNASGCDSILTVNLTINNTANTIAESTCDSYVSPSGNFNWTASGTYIDTLPNAAGCDSILTINLTIIGTSVTNSITETACQTYTSPSGNYTWTVSGTYPDTLQSAAGCDSILIIGLTITGIAVSDSITETACISYTSPSGNQVWTTSGMYTDTLVSSTGCDSIIAIDLTIGAVDTGVMLTAGVLTASAASATYQWIDCDGNQPISGETAQSYQPSTTGNYAVIITQNGCTDTSECQNVVVVGIENDAFPVELLFYPNPTSGQITLDLGEVRGNIGLRVIDAEGKVVRSMEGISSSRIQLELGHAPGLYTVLLYGENTYRTIRVMKVE